MIRLTGQNQRTSNLCLGLSQCYSPPLVQRAWVRCSRWLGVFLRHQQMRKQVPQRENLLVTLPCQMPVSKCKRHSSVSQTKIPHFLLALLVGLSLLSGCSTFSQSQYSVQFGQVSHSLPLPHPKIKNPSSSSGDSSNSQAEQTSPLQSQQDTSHSSLWQHSPALWDSILHLPQEETN